ncbi:hypothetical protein OSTOST_23824, partial [Ostertagia ostertagi]
MSFTAFKFPADSISPVSSTESPGLLSDEFPAKGRPRYMRRRWLDSELEDIRVTVLQVYAPTADSDEEQHDDFYEQLAEL